MAIKPTVVLRTYISGKSRRVLFVENRDARLRYAVAVTGVGVIYSNEDQDRKDNFHKEIAWSESQNADFDCSRQAARVGTQRQSGHEVRAGCQMIMRVDKRALTKQAKRGVC